MKKVISLLLIAVLCFVSVPAVASAAVKISKTKTTVYQGESVKLKITGTKSTVKWTSSDKSIATVTSKGKVSAISEGKATITAAVGKSKYKCVVTVKPTRYVEGTYKVGKDIPSGEYVLLTKKGGDGYYAVSSDNTKSVGSILVNNNFYNNSIVTVNDGTYLELKRCYAVSFDDTKVDTSGDGTFKIGTHLDAGEYKIISTSENSYIKVFTDSTNSVKSMIAVDVFDTSTYVTVEDGQYLYIRYGKIEK